MSDEWIFFRLLPPSSSRSFFFSFLFHYGRRRAERRELASTSLNVNEGRTESSFIFTSTKLTGSLLLCRMSFFLHRRRRSSALLCLDLLCCCVFSFFYFMCIPKRERESEKMFFCCCCRRFERARGCEATFRGWLCSRLLCPPLLQPYSRCCALTQKNMARFFFFAFGLRFLFYHFALCATLCCVLFKLSREDEHILCVCSLCTSWWGGCLARATRMEWGRSSSDREEDER